MKVHDIPKSGKRGKIVAFKSRFGQCEREHTPATKRPTAKQQQSASAFGAASLGWNGLTDEQLDAWRAYGKKVRSHPRGGQSGPLTGQNLFTAINRNQALLDLPPFVYPPERPAFDANPVQALTITLDGDGIALKLSVAQAPAAPILVFASRPLNAGRRYWDKFRYLGLLPPSHEGQCDITAQYLKVFGSPWPNSRIILHLVQQVDGWRDLPHQVEAVFRPIPPVSPPSPRRQAPVAAR
jgi:hypothetical protein